MKAKHNDKIKAKPLPMFDEVWIDVSFSNGVNDTIMLDPEAARRLARKINRAASVIEIKQKGRAIV